MTATLYAWDDVGAPSPRIENVGDIYNILKTVMFVGYGSRPAHGQWQLIFDDPANNTMVIKHVTDEIYYRLDNNDDFRYVEVATGTGATDVDTLTGNWIGSNVSRGWMRLSAQSAFGGRWFLILDDDGDFLNMIGHGTFNNNTAGWALGKTKRASESGRKHFIQTSNNTSESSGTQALFIRGVFVDSLADGVAGTGFNNITSQYLERFVYNVPTRDTAEYILEQFEVIAGGDFLGFLPNRWRVSNDNAGLLHFMRSELGGVKYIPMRINDASFEYFILFEYDNEEA